LSLREEIMKPLLFETVCLVYTAMITRN